MATLCSPGDSASGLLQTARAFAASIQYHSPLRQCPMMWSHAASESN